MATLEFDHISMVYEGSDHSVRALDSLALTIAEGELLTGASEPRLRVAWDSASAKQFSPSHPPRGALCDVVAKSA